MLSIMMLGGCAEMNSKFDCPMKPGVRCESLDQVNARVDGSELGSASAPSYSQIVTTDSYTTMEENSYQVPFRSKEKIVHIWIAPYVDKDGNYHDGNNVYSVRKASKWDRG